MNSKHITLRKAILPIEMELDEQQGENSQSEKDDTEDMQCYAKKMNAFKDNIFLKAKCNIVNAQRNQKKDYDKRHGKKKVLVYHSIYSCCYQLLFSVIETATRNVGANA